MNCSICNRDTPEEYIEKHHLVPKAKKGKETIDVCCDCGDQIHQLFTNKELKNKFNTLEKLLAEPQIQGWVKWVQAKRFGITMARKKGR